MIEFIKAASFGAAFFWAWIFNLHTASFLSFSNRGRFDTKRYSEPRCKAIDTEDHEKRIAVLEENGGRSESVGSSPKTGVGDGIKKFVDWYVDFYKVKL